MIILNVGMGTMKPDLNRLKTKTSLNKSISGAVTCPIRVRNCIEQCIKFEPKARPIFLE